MGGKGSKSKKSKKDAPEKETSISFSSEGETKIETKHRKSKKEIKQEKEDKKIERKQETENEKKEQKAVGRATSKKVSSRLGGNLGIEFEEKKKDGKREKLFQAPKGPEHSKIFNALNPQKLYFESRREKEEAEEETIEIELNTRDYGFHRDDDGNFLPDAEEEEEEEEDEDFDPESLPDFGEFQTEMNKLQQQREEKQKEHQRQLREQYLAKKKEEELEWEKELTAIREKEAAIAAAKVDNKEGFVEEAQSRVEEETAAFIKKFSFR
eukprot:m.29887 g.29887  ORF g.29887 m.29887 type:complete len:268 (+) comp6187_c1_seq1:216-1019(+)